MFYGTTPRGTKIHMGTEIVHRASLDENMIKTYCGSYMWDNSFRDPAQGDKFCATCFRKEAWAMFQERLSWLAKQPRRYSA